MRKQPTGTLVIELNHGGIPDAELKPEEFDERQLAVLAALEPWEQEKFRKGYPVIVTDLGTGATLAAFNKQNIKPTRWQMESLARGLLKMAEEYRSDPEKWKKVEEWQREHGKSGTDPATPEPVKKRGKSKNRACFLGVLR